MQDGIETAEEKAITDGPAHPKVPGVVVVWSLGAPACRAMRVENRARVLGRGSDADHAIEDHVLSRRHVSITWDAQGWLVTDLDSRNGTFVDGARVSGSVHPKRDASIVRLGQSVLMLVPDVVPYEDAVALVQDDYVIGPAMRAMFAEVADAAASGRTLLAIGETGTGKERVAEVYHQAGPTAAGAVRSGELRRGAA